MLLPCTCDKEKRLERVPADSLTPYQRELKTLSKERYAKLKKSMAQYGFTVPLFIWKSGKKRFILDGHQRLRVLTTEKWEVDGGIPIVSVEANSAQEAAEKLLVIASQYGEMSSQGLYEFGDFYDLKLSEFDFAELPNINWDEFTNEYFGDGEDDAPPDDRIPDQFDVLVICETQEQQTETLERLMKEGYECRAIIS